jgi:hypothetical protein
MMAPSSDDGFIARTVGLAALGCVGTSDCVGLNAESIGARPCLLRPAAAYCSSSHPNSASSASNVGGREGEPNCFICTFATPYRNPKLMGQLVRVSSDNIAAAPKNDNEHADFCHDRDI